MRISDWSSDVCSSDLIAWYTSRTDSVSTILYSSISFQAFSSPLIQASQSSKPGRVAESAVGKAGQRQAREQTQANIEPMARLDNRINNRVQNRIRNRNERY